MGNAFGSCTWLRVSCERRGGAPTTTPDAPSPPNPTRARARCLPRPLRPTSGYILSQRRVDIIALSNPTRSRAAGTAVHVLWAKGGDCAGRHPRLGAGPVARRRLRAGLRAVRRRETVVALRCEGGC